MNPMALLQRVRGSGQFVRLFSSTVTNQVILSGANLVVGLLLIRATATEQYGYYLLVINSILLLNSLQGAFMGPPLALRIAKDGTAACAGLVGGLARAQSRITRWAAALLLAVAAVGWSLGLLKLPLALLLGGAVIAAVSAMYREFFRCVLFVSRKPHAVLIADVIYVVGQLGGALLASRTSMPALVALVTAGLSAMLGGYLLERTVIQSEGIDYSGSPSVWREIASVGGWSVGGAGAHWTFNQGYNYVVAAMLDLSSVSALGATRLLLMPVNLLAQGVSPLVLPFAAVWLERFGPRTLFRRILMIAGSVTVLSMLYLVVLWFTRDWIFEHLMHKHFPHADALLEIWSVTFLLSAFRDRLATIPGTFSRYRMLFYATAATAVLAVVCCWIGIRVLGLVGAPLAVLVGELVSFVSVLAYSIYLTRHYSAAAQTVPAHVAEVPGT